MLPTVVDSQLTEGLRRHLEIQFKMTTPHFRDLWNRFFQHMDELVKGPYLQLSMPFRKSADGEQMTRFAPAIDKLPFPPYLHQVKAYDRLTAEFPQSTLVATGTGSGKTECFLYPILSYCAAHLDQKGIKAILIYPMNALATDQAARIAELISRYPGLKGIRAALYVGEDKIRKSVRRVREMEPHSVITDRTAIRNSPPDILLTNYKMLDYMLVRPDDLPLWQYNSSGELRFCVVDELHTFDGAQAADLALLLRRLKERLHQSDESICCIGTSATLGSGEAASADIRSYAETIFGCAFPEDALIREERKSAAEMLPDETGPFILPKNLDDYNPQPEDTVDGFIKRQLACWGFGADNPYSGGVFMALTKDVDQENEFDEAILKVFGNSLFKNIFVRQALLLSEGKCLLPEQFAERLLAALDDDPAYLELGEHTREEPRGAIIPAFRSLCSLLSVLRAHAGRDWPEVRVQYWARELTRMVADLDTREANLVFGNDLSDPDKLRDRRVVTKDDGERVTVEKNYLPIANCRSCGCTGWVGLYLKKSHDAIGGTPTEIYTNFFDRRSEHIRFVLPLEEGEGKPQHLQPGGEVRRLCTQCKKLVSESAAECPYCGSKELQRVALQPPRSVTTRTMEGVPFTRRSMVCPICGAEDEGMLLVGMRVATLLSHFLSILSGSIFNTDKKFLAFSDSVQDASHRAGFFNGRTWSSTFRSYVGHYCKAEMKRPVPLKEFEAGFLKNLEEKMLPDRAELFASLLPQDLKWMNDWQRLAQLEPDQEEPKISEPIFKCLVKRLRWELRLELGLRSRIGRTLEQTGVAAAYVQLPGADDPCWEKMSEALRNGNGSLRELTAERLRVATFRLTLIMLRNGAISGPVVNSILTMGGLWALRQIGTKLSKDKTLSYPLFKGMSPKGSRLQFPARFDGKAPASARSMTLSIGGGELLAREVSRCGVVFGECAMGELFERLTQAGILERTGNASMEGLFFWTLPEESVYVSSGGDLVCRRCALCQRTQWVSSTLLTSLGSIGESCFSSLCAGKTVPHDAPESIYKSQYGQGDIVRVNALEHTGLLKRDDRELLERQFKARPSRPWFPNMISATPTLEMGIDIGNLSTVMLCSVPPTQAQYLQRIGRSGRSTGSALNLTVASTRPHDQYFFREPEEMMTGTVDTPGVFLNAPSIVKRQYLGFALSEWLLSPAHPCYPDKVRALLKGIEADEKNAFPNDFFAWYELNKEKLFDRFSSRLRGVDDAVSELAKYAKSAQGSPESMSCELNTEIMRTKEIAKQYRLSADAIGKEIKKVKKDPSLTPELRDKTVAELKDDRAAFTKLRSNLIGQRFIGWLCDTAGLLPNYAFPEPGVELVSIIVQRVSKEGPTIYKRLRVCRPSSSALRELVPGSRFYSNGYNVKIDAVDLNATPEQEAWRFCPNCDYCDPEAECATQNCPVCGCDWSDRGQVRYLMPATQFVTCKPENEALNDDKSDNRTPVYYDCKRFFKCQGGERVYFSSADESVPFAYEYIEHLSMREVNFGRHVSNPNPAEIVEVNGEKVTGGGFSLCPSCGHVLLNPGDAHKSHSAHCPYHGKGEDECPWEEVSFYRQYSTEALRIFVPFLDEKSEIRLASLMAAFTLGLKLHFGGKVEHLRLEAESLPTQTRGCRKNFIILYDTVPGGTGKIRDFEKDRRLIFTIFREALAHLKNCSCQNFPERDGCYHCLYRYRNQSVRSRLSRRTAIEVLERLLLAENKIQQTSSIPDHEQFLGPLLESELEVRFVGRLKSFVKAHGGSFELTAVRGLNKGIRLTLPGALGIGGQPGDRVWECAFQQDIGGSQGVIQKSRPDVVFHPISADAKEARPVAVFLDGWQYHRNIIRDDVQKRTALMEAGYRVWSMGWDDVEPTAAEKAEENVPSWLEILQNVDNGDQKNALYSSFLPNLDLHSAIEADSDFNQHPQEFDRLMTYLATMNDDLFQRHALVESFILWKIIQGTRPAAAPFSLQLPPYLGQFWQPPEQTQWWQVQRLHFLLTLIAEEENGQRIFRTHALATIDENTEEPTESEWREFFLFCDYFQFSKKFYAYPESSINSSFWTELEEASSQSRSAEWQEVFEIFGEDEELSVYLTELEKANLPAPEYCQDLGEGSMVDVNALLSWEDKQVALVGDDVDIQALDGWTLIRQGEGALEKLIQVLKGNKGA